MAPIGVVESTSEFVNEMNELRIEFQILYNAKERIVLTLLRIVQCKERNYSRNLSVKRQLIA